MSTGNTYKVSSVEKVDNDLFILMLERGNMEFSPGDCVALYAESAASRPYSIASGIHEDSLRFLIREMEGGNVSPWLAKRKPGDLVQVSSPFGWFRPRQHEGIAPSVFIATGTGIAPFLSFRESFPENAPETLLFGARTEAAAIGFDRFDGWCNAHLALSREEASGHHFGRVTDLLDDHVGCPDTHYYLCGLESMITQVTAQLEERGVDFFRIHREVFFHDQ